MQVETNENNAKGVAGRTDYATWDKVASDLIEQAEAEEKEEEQDGKAKLGLDGKYARSAAEKEEREKAIKVKKVKKKLEAFQSREEALVTEFQNVFSQRTVFRITRNELDAGKRVLRIVDSDGGSSSSSQGSTTSSSSKIVLTQDLSGIESKMAMNPNAKQFADDVENDTAEAPQQQPRNIYGIIKVFISNVKNCEILVKCKIITNYIELHDCHNVTLKIEKEATVATIQADLCENLKIEFRDAPSGKSTLQNQLYWGDDKDDRIFHAGCKNLTVSIYRDDYCEASSVSDYERDGAVAIGNARATEYQFVTSLQQRDDDDGDATLVTEAVVRSATGQHGRAMTERELKESQEKRQHAAQMAVQMADSMVQIKDKEGNVLVTKKKEGDDVIEVYSSSMQTEIETIVSECEILKKRGNEAFGTGEYGQAILQYSLSIDKAAELPNSSLFATDIVLSNRSAAFLKLGQHEKAEGDAKAALKLNPDNVKALFRLGLALHAAGQYESAMPILGQALQREPHNKQIQQAVKFCEVRLEQERRKRMEQ